MADPKPFASLSSGLLARKGAARPAMRPQGFGQVGGGLEDLGWNDMGFEPPKPNTGPRDATHDAFGEEIDGEPRVHHPTGLTPVQSPVHDQQAELADRLGIDTEDEEFDETAELYDPNAVDQTEDEAEDTEADESYDGDTENAGGYASFEVQPGDVPEKPKKQPLQLSGGFDETTETAAEDEPFEPTEGYEEPSETAAADEPLEPTEVLNGTPDTTAADEPFELTERFEDFDPFQQTEDTTPPPAPVLQTGYSPASAYQPTPRAAAGSKGKAAFTLRLDPERHLKLRLACAVNGRSAQQIVTDAVDQLLRTMPELDAMAEKAKRRG